jgi:hypothetical protein
VIEEALASLKRETERERESGLSDCMRGFHIS